MAEFEAVRTYDPKLLAMSAGLHTATTTPLTLLGSLALNAPVKNSLSSQSGLLCRPIGHTTTGLRQQHRCIQRNSKAFLLWKEIHFMTDSRHHRYRRIYCYLWLPPVRPNDVPFC